MAQTKTDPDKFFLKNLFYFVDYVMSQRLLIVMAALIAIGGIVFIAPLSILFLPFLLIAVVLKFSVDILLSSAEGSFDPDDISFSDAGYGIVFQFIVIGILMGYLASKAIEINSTSLNFLVYFVFPLITPAIYMVLAYTGSLLEALNPLTIIRFIKPWFVTYVLFALFYLLTQYLQERGVVAVLSNSLSFKMMYVITVSIMIFFTFLNFHIMGFLIYQNFNEQGEEIGTLEAEGGNQSSNNTTGNAPSFDNPIYNRIQSLIQSEETDEALAIIKELQKDGDDSQELQKFKQLATVAAANKAEAPVAQRIHDLVLKNKLGQAFSLLQEVYANKEPYLETAEKDLTLLAKHAYQSGKFPLVLKILNGFNKKYPNSQDIVPNYYLVAQILYKNPQTQAKALAILHGLIKKYPQHGMMTEIKSWTKGIELMNKKKPQI